MSRWIFLKKKNNKVKLSVNLKILAFYGGRAERMEQQRLGLFFFFIAHFLSLLRERMIGDEADRKQGQEKKILGDYLLNTKCQKKTGHD
jgi:hypothetical protein